jgi:DNA-directed RNA polymerase specialized sigma24 family protein
VGSLVVPINSGTKIRLPPMPDMTRILSQIEQGDRAPAEQLLPLVYDELRRLAARKLAHEEAGQTLQPTALVHEAYLRLFGDSSEQQWDSHRHFLLLPRRRCGE